MKHEPMIRLGVFCGIFLSMLLWEAIAPWRQRSTHKRMRWYSNMGLLGLGTVLLRVVFPLAAVGVAAIAQAQNWGLLHLISLPRWQTLVLSIVGLDFAVYLQHVLFHALPTLWRLHQVHHTDPDFDVTTGVRFHPLELLLSMAIKIAIVGFLGTPVIAVLIFELLLNATSLFNHGNVRLPVRVDRLLRWMIVTPDMHRIHHSVIPQESNRNFGFNLPWWDYLFGTYQQHPSAGYQKMGVGLAEYQHDARVEQLPWLLILPFIHRSLPDNR